VKTWNEFKRDLEQEYGPLEPDALSLASDIIRQVISKRLDVGLTQAQLAEIAGLKQPAIARLESFTVVPRLDTLVKVLDALGLRLAVEDTHNKAVEPVAVRYDLGDMALDPVTHEPTQGPPLVDLSASYGIESVGTDEYSGFREVA
jgi:transcriptional regulator with XRE-family HTH domain